MKRISSPAVFPVLLSFDPCLNAFLRVMLWVNVRFWPQYKGELVDGAFQSSLQTVSSSASCLDIIHCRSKSHPRRSDLILNFPGAFRGFDGDSQLGIEVEGWNIHELHGWINRILAGKAYHDINTYAP